MGGESGCERKSCTASGSGPSGRFDRFRNKVYCLIAVCLTLAFGVPLASAQTTFLTFDTLQGRPIAISGTLAIRHRCQSLHRSQCSRSERCC
jgi:hypothetical protein